MEFVDQLCHVNVDVGHRWQAAPARHVEGCNTLSYLSLNLAWLNIEAGTNAD